MMSAKTLKRRLSGMEGFFAKSPAETGTKADAPDDIPTPRTWIFFYLICLVAILWATFLLVTRQMLWLSSTLFFIAGGIGLFTFVVNVRLRTWVFFYLICFVALLWALFLKVQGIWLWESLFLVIVSCGSSLFAYFLCDHHHIPGSETIASLEVSSGTGESMRVWPGPGPAATETEVDE